MGIVPDRTRGYTRLNSDATHKADLKEFLDSAMTPRCSVGDVERVNVTRQFLSLIERHLSGGITLLVG